MTATVKIETKSRLGYFYVVCSRCAETKLGSDITEVINAEQKLYTAGADEVKHDVMIVPMQYSQVCYAVLSI